MPSLQLHQLRVAAVGKLICDNLRVPVDTRTVLLECLFHDMGNIVKFDLAYFPEFMQPEGQAYWESVKADFLQKYGTEQHSANAEIAREIGLPVRVIEIMNASGFSRIRNIVDTGSLELKVCQYADLRVAPHGVISLEERLQDFNRRYANKNDSAPQGHFHFSNTGYRVEKSVVHEETLHASRELELQIFAETSITPLSINDISVAPLLNELSEYPCRVA